MDLKCSFSMIDCVQSAFSLKICLVLISASAIANHDVTSLLWGRRTKSWASMEVPVWDMQEAS